MPIVQNERTIVNMNAASLAESTIFRPSVGNSVAVYSPLRVGRPLV